MLYYKCFFESIGKEIANPESANHNCSRQNFNFFVFLFRENNLAFHVNHLPSR